MENLEKSLRPADESLASELRVRHSQRQSGNRGGPRRNNLLPDLQIHYRPIDQLKAPERNVRMLQQQHIARVGRSLEAFGVCRPILTKNDGTIVDGLVVKEAAKQLGLDHVPVIDIGHLTEGEIRLALNRVQEKGAGTLSPLVSNLRRF